MSSGTLHGLFIQQAARTPNAPAVICDAGSLSYIELAQRSQRLSHALRSRDFAPESLIGVHLPSSHSLPVGLLGILQSGCAFLPLDSRHPKQRSAQILDDARPSLVIYDDTVLLASAPGGDPPADDSTRHDALAYVIYTSGSTGNPKGVQITHAAATNTIAHINAICEVGPTDRVLNVSSLGFDLSIYDFFGAWAAGASVVLTPDRAYPEPGDWVASMSIAHVTIWNSAPALLEMLLDFIERDLPARRFCLDRLRVAMLSGDRISPKLIQRLVHLQPKVRVLAMGGATEAAIWSVHNWVERLPADAPFVPYGRALPQQSIVVLDSLLDEVAEGEAGDLYIGGVGLARGYRNRADLTAARFIPDPRGCSERLYVTGDRVRRIAGDNTEFLGRNDGQVKIRGFRVELAEVEHALQRIEGVEQSAVICAPTPAGPQLRGYVTARHGATQVQPTYLRECLSLSLPSYMIPERLHCLAAMPLSPNGKVDRARLSADAIEQLDGVAEQRDFSSLAPGDDTQEEVAAAWREVLSISAFDVHEPFLELGGNSLLALQIVSRLSDVFQIELTIRDLFENPTVADFATLVDEQLAATNVAR